MEFSKIKSHFCFHAQNKKTNSIKTSLTLAFPLFICRLCMCCFHFRRLTKFIIYTNEFTIMWNWTKKIVSFTGGKCFSLHIGVQQLYDENGYQHIYCEFSCSRFFRNPLLFTADSGVGCYRNMVFGWINVQSCAVFSGEFIVCTAIWLRKNNKKVNLKSNR